MKCYRIRDTGQLQDVEFRSKPYCHKCRFVCKKMTQDGEIEFHCVLIMRELNRDGEWETKSKITAPEWCPLELTEGYDD